MTDQTLSVKFEADVAELRQALADVRKRVADFANTAESAADALWSLSKQAHCAS